MKDENGEKQGGEKNNEGEDFREEKEKDCVANE